jgi:CRISPR-associated endonuclease Cas2
MNKPCPTTSPEATRPHAAIPLLVAYDISDDRRRNRLYRLLHGFGEPVQKSIFICWVDAVRRRRLETLLDDFCRAPHKGDERIDCIPARTQGLHLGRPQSDWIFE